MLLKYLILSYFISVECRSFKWYSKTVYRKYWKKNVYRYVQSLAVTNKIEWPPYFYFFTFFIENKNIYRRLSCAFTSFRYRNKKKPAKGKVFVHFQKANDVFEIRN